MASLIESVRKLHGPTLVEYGNVYDVDVICSECARLRTEALEQAGTDGDDYTHPAELAHVPYPCPTRIVAGTTAAEGKDESARMRLEHLVVWREGLEDPTALRLADLALRAGGFEVLAELDTTPLPTEELALEQVSEDLRGLATEIDEHLVDGATALLEQQLGSAEIDEFLTACRRLLVRVAQLDDAVLRRKASTRITAAAIVSIIARGNDLMGYSPAPLHEKDLRRAFDLRGGPNQRARGLMDAAALPHRFTGIALADPGLLLGTARARMLQERDTLRAE